MNELNVAAQGTANAWCKGDLRKEAESKNAGDSYCAIGHMAKALADIQGLEMSFDGHFVGPADRLAKYDEYMLNYRAWILDGRPEDSRPENVYDESLIESYELIDTHASGKILAETIIANYSDRVRGHEKCVEMAEWTAIIYNFNDHKDTTREDVVAMMEKAALSLDDARALEDKTADDLVNEIDELLSV